MGECVDHGLGTRQNEGTLWRQHCWTHATFVVDANSVSWTHKKVFLKSSETFLVNLRRGATMFSAAATNRHHRRTQCCRHECPLFPWALLSQRAPSGEWSNTSSRTAAWCSDSMSSQSDEENDAYWAKMVTVCCDVSWKQSDWGPGRLHFRRSLGSGARETCAWRQDNQKHLSWCRGRRKRFRPKKKRNCTQDSTNNNVDSPTRREYRRRKHSRPGTRARSSQSRIRIWHAQKRCKCPQSIVDNLQHSTKRSGIKRKVSVWFCFCLFVFVGGLSEREPGLRQKLNCRTEPALTFPS